MGKPEFHLLQYVAKGWVENAAAYPSGNKSRLSNLREGDGHTSSSVGWVENAAAYPYGNKSRLSNLREGDGHTSSSVEG